MALATESNAPGVVDSAGGVKTSTTPAGPQILRTALALALMTTAANCFLKYLWWAACYSAWSGIPKLAAQWRAAGNRASFYGWTVILLELASLLLIYSLIRIRQTSFFRNVVRMVASLAITLVASGLLALALSWIKQSH